MKKKNNDVGRRLIECYLVSSFLLWGEIGLDLSSGGRQQPFGLMPKF